MIAIETELGRFEADTEEEALRQVRAAKRKAAKQEKIDQHNRKEATRRAYEAGYRVLSRLAKYDKGPQGWVVYQPHTKYFPPCKYEESHNVYCLETEWGYGRFAYYRFMSGRSTEMVGALVNRAGFFFAVWVQEGDELKCYAIGVHENQTAMVPLPNVMMSSFRISDYV